MARVRTSMTENGTGAREQEHGRNRAESEQIESLAAVQNLPGMFES